jgi:hypothetical protein
VKPRDRRHVSAERRGGRDARTEDGHGGRHRGVTTDRSSEPRCSDSPGSCRH